MFSPVKLAQNAEAAKDVAAIINAEGCVLEMKYDGIRLLAHVTDTGVEFWTRSGKSATGKLPNVAADLAHLPAGTWLDGEIVGLRIREDGSIEHNWSTAQSVMGSNVDRAARMSHVLTYVVFDVLAIGGTDARSLPLSKRRGLLEQMFAGSEFKSCSLTPQMDASDEACAAIIAAGFEGVIVKRLSAPYASGQRGKGFYKIKATDTVDAVIMGYQPGEGKYDGQLGALLLGHYVGGTLVQVAKCSGMSDAERLAMSQNPGDYIGAVVEFKHFGVMPTGGYRHPQYFRMRGDKLATECVA